MRPSLPWDGNDRDYSYKELLREHRGLFASVGMSGRSMQAMWALPGAAV